MPMLQVVGAHMEMLEAESYHQIASKHRFGGNVRSRSCRVINPTTIYVVANPGVKVSLANLHS